MSFQQELSHMLSSGWTQLDEWNGLRPQSEFYVIAGGYSANRYPVLQRFRCGAILYKEPSHVKFVDGEWVPVGNGRIWIIRVTDSGQQQGGMSGSSIMFPTKEKALAAVENLKSQRIVMLRKNAEELLAEATELEAEQTPELEILNFTVDCDEIPL